MFRLSGTFVLASIAFLGGAAAAAGVDWPKLLVIGCLIGVLICAVVAIGFSLIGLGQWWRSPRRRITFHAPLQVRSLDIAAASGSDTMGGPDPDRLIQFAVASFIPAWHACVSVIVALRGEIGRREGPRIEGLFQFLLDMANDPWRALDARLREGVGPESLEACLARAYERYELMVRWIWFGGELHGYPRPGDKRLAEWWKADERMLDKLQDLVALPEFSGTGLREAFQRHRDGGGAAEIRQKLTPPTHARLDFPAVVEPAPRIVVSGAGELSTPVAFYSSGRVTAHNFFAHIRFLNLPERRGVEASARGVTARLAVFYGEDLALEWWGKWRASDDRLERDMRRLRQIDIDPDGQEAELDVTVRNPEAYTVFGYNHDNLRDEHGFDESKVIRPGAHKLRVTLQGINLPPTQYWFRLTCGGPSQPVVLEQLDIHKSGFSPEATAAAAPFAD